MYARKATGIKNFNFINSFTYTVYVRLVRVSRGSSPHSTLASKDVFDLDSVQEVFSRSLGKRYAAAVGRPLLVYNSRRDVENFYKFPFNYECRY